MNDLVGTYYEIEQEDSWFNAACHITITDSLVVWKECKLHKDAMFINPRIIGSILYYDSKSHKYTTSIEIFTKNGTLHLEEIMEENQSIILKKKN